MRNRIIIKGERVATTRSTTTVESTTFYQKAYHFQKIVARKLESMGVKAQVILRKI